MASQKDVARLADVSHGTVSNVIRGEVNVSPEKAQRVRDAIASLNYEVNTIASSLKTSKTRTVGFIASDMFDTFYAGMARAVQELLQKNDYSTIICYGSDDPAQELRYLQVLRSKRVDGIILTPSRDDNRDYINQLSETGTCVVTVDNHIDGANCDFVGVENAKGAYAAVDHLIQNGYRKIAIINAHVDCYTGRERYRGYSKALQDSRLSTNHRFVKLAEYQKDNVVSHAEELFTGREKPDAIFTTDLFTTLRTYKTLKDMGLRVPGDVALAGFDDLSIGSQRVDLLDVVSLPITCVRQPVYDLGKTAAELLIERMEGRQGCDDGQAANKLLKTELIVRESSQPRR